MLRYVAPSRSVKPLLQSPRITVSRQFATRKDNGAADEEEIDAARKWLANLDADTIREKAVCDVSFSRSSGPGGQNVNKSVVICTSRILVP